MEILKYLIVGGFMLGVIALIVFIYVWIEEKFGTFLIWLVAFFAVFATILGYCVIEFLNIL